MNLFRWVGALLLGMVALPLCANAQQCNLSRRSIGFKVTMCSTRGCNTGIERIDIVGDNAIHYENRLQAAGTVYKIGKTVDFCVPQTDSYKPNLCRNEAGPVRATGTAFFNGTELRLHLVQSFAVLGRPATLTQIISIIVSACTSCRVVQLGIDIVSADGRIRDGSHMAGPEAEVCEIVDTASLPH